MNDEEEKRDVRAQTKTFAVRIIRPSVSLPKTPEAQVLDGQVPNSGTSVGAHYREGTRARSTAEFVSKIEGGHQELEETVYWLEHLIEAGIAKEARITRPASRSRRADLNPPVVSQNSKRGKMIKGHFELVAQHSVHHLSFIIPRLAASIT